MLAVDEEIRKRESALEVASARRLAERFEHERVTRDNFNNEMKRRQERLDELDREKSNPSGCKIQSANEYERLRRSEAQSALGGASKPQKDNTSQGGGGDRDREMKGDRDLKGDRDRDGQRSVGD